MSPDRLSSHGPRASRRHRPTRSAVRRSDWLLENLESRTLLSITIDDLPTIFGGTFPAGKSIELPITATSTTGPLTYTVTTSNPSLVALVNSIKPAVSAGRTFVRFTTSMGNLDFQLFNDVAPLTVAHLLSNLNSPDYVNSIFHRIIQQDLIAVPPQSLSIVQGGDRNGDGVDNNVGLALEQELDPHVLYTGHGQLAEARTNQPDSGGSQFFITLETQRFLDLNYTIFGQLVRGFDVLAALNSVPTDANDRPITPPTLISVAVINDPTDAVITLTSSSNTPLSGSITVTAHDGVGNVASKIFNVSTVTDIADDPPFLRPPSVVNRAIPKNVTTNIPFTGTVDLEGNAFTISGAFVNTPSHFTASIPPGGASILITPDAGYTGPIQVVINAKETANASITSGRTYTFFVDSGAGPTYTLIPKDVFGNAGAASTFKITYTDDTLVDVSTLVNNNTLVSVTGPNGFVRNATFVSIDSPTNGKSRTVTYQIIAPGGLWDAPDAGRYLVNIKGASAKDTLGNGAGAGVAGAFFYSPSVYYDERYYLSMNPDIASVVAAGALPSGWAHFIAVGQTEGRPATPFFNEKMYRGLYPDIRNAIAAGAFKSGWQHFVIAGAKEGRYGSDAYREADYLRFNTDVAAAVTAGGFSSGLEHFILAGQYENRRSSIFFDVRQYVANNADVVAVVASGLGGLYRSATLHFLISGQKEGRAPNSLFSESYYLSHNTDVAAVVSAKVFVSGFEHFVINGAREKRDPSVLFNTAYYIANHSDVAAALLAGTVKSAFEHYILIGQGLGYLTHA